MNLADALNLECLCTTLRPQLLRAQLDAGAPDASWADEVAATRPHLFSATPVFISAADYVILEESVATLHRATSLPGFSALATARAPQIARHDFGPSGVFMGYDFHMSEHGPRLIEINTNAGGALLHAAAARAHRACCTPLDPLFSRPADLSRFGEVVLQMFRSEWSAQRGDAKLGSVAIVDDAPAQQYLAPEFELARQLLQSHGIDAVIADAGELQWRDGRLWHPNLPGAGAVDLVYNRLTDFYLAEARHAALHQAYVSGSVVVTPHPRAHALHADKRNLVSLSDGRLMGQLGAADADLALLHAVVPATVPVTAGNAETLWTRRRHLFFKPYTGYGSRAAYRGDKLTRKVWSEIVGGGFVAQALVAPSERTVEVDGEPRRLKVDVRAFAYAGRVQLLAARTYSGQTTNFRTPGGGFSPVVVLPETSPAGEPRAQPEPVPTACPC
jgi:hypothetical protein